jgi:hypothetical protein
MHPPPLGGFRRLSWGYAVLRGLKRTYLGRVWVAPGPYGVSTPFRHSASAPSPPPKRQGGPPWTSAPLQSSITGTPRRPATRRRQVRRHFLSWTSCALRHSLRPADPLAGGGSLRHRVPRAGFGYPLRDVHHRPSRHAEAYRSVLGLHPSRSSPRHDRCPSRSPCPPVVTPPQLSLPGGQRATTMAGFRALFP